MKDTSRAESAAAAPTAGYNQGIDAGSMEVEGLGDDTIMGVGDPEMEFIDVISSKEVMWWIEKENVTDGTTLWQQEGSRHTNCHL